MRRILKLAGALAIAGALAGCGGAPAVAQANAKDPGAVEAVSARPAAPWQTYRDPMFGFSVALPDEPMWVHSKDDRSGVEQRGFHVDLDTIEMDALLTTGGDRHVELSPKLFAEQMRKEMTVASQVAKVERGGLMTYEVSGKAKGGGPIRMLAASAGVDLLTLAIHGDKTLDDAMVERFFDSARVEPPWHLEAFADGLTVALPPEAHASGQQTRNDVVITSFMTSAEPTVWFGVSTKAFPPPAKAGTTTEELLDLYVSGMTRSGGKMVRQTKITQSGLVGREVITTTDKTQHLRTRVFIVAHTIYAVALGSEDEDALMSDTATRVLDSMRVRPSP